MAYRGDLIAIGLNSDIEILDTITGIRTPVLLGHQEISFLTFSLDGTLLLSGDHLSIVNLWDVQTGGSIKTFGNNRTPFSAASISPDNAMIALGCEDGKIYLSDVRTGKLHPMMSSGTRIYSITFSPIDPRCFLWSSFRTVHQWGRDGHQIGASYHDTDISWVEDLAYLLDGTRFVFCGRKVAVVWDSESGEQVVKLHSSGVSDLLRCCFLPDGKFVACGSGDYIYIWNITILGAPLVKNLAGHSDCVSFLTFSSSLISGSRD